MTIREALDNINEYKVVSDYTLYKSFLTIRNDKIEKRPTIEKIKDIVREFELDSKSRKQIKCFQRYYLMNLMWYSLHMTPENIGDILNRDRTTVLRGLQEHRNFKRYDFEMYKEAYKPVELAFKLF